MSIQSNYSKILEYLNDQTVIELGKEDKEILFDICSFYECEPSALAEIIAEEYEVPKNEIYALL